LGLSAETIVIGAGPAGLTTAYQLAKDGRSVLVLEADPKYVGGISRTVNHKGFLFDIGGHRFFSKSKEIVDLWDEILPDDFIERPPGEAEAKDNYEWVRNQFGERLFSIFFKTHTEKVWSMSCDEISADWAAQRIKGLDLCSAGMDQERDLRRSPLRVVTHGVDRFHRAPVVS
jgi:protoporphyrinogen oxidase